MLPFKDGGVNIPSFLRDSILLRHAALSKGVNPQALSGFKLNGCNETG